MIAVLCQFSLTIPLGLWVQSSLVRYAGAVYMLLMGAALVVVLAGAYCRWRDNEIRLRIVI